MPTETKPQKAHYAERPGRPARPDRHDAVARVRVRRRGGRAGGELGRDGRAGPGEGARRACRRSASPGRGSCSLMLTESCLISLAGGVLGTVACVAFLLWKPMSLSTEGVSIDFVASPGAGRVGAGAVAGRRARRRGGPGVAGRAGRDRDLVAVIVMRLLPWDYGVRNLARRPLRTALTGLGLALVVFLLLLVVGFVRGLELSLAAERRPGGGAAAQRERRREPGELVDHRRGADPGPDRVRRAPRQVRRDAGRLAGADHRRPRRNDRRGRARLRSRCSAAWTSTACSSSAGRWRSSRARCPDRARCWSAGSCPRSSGCSAADVAVGQSLTIEGRPWRVSGRFAAPGTLLEAEIWCRLDDLKTAMKRPNDVSVVAMRFDPAGDPVEADGVRRLLLPQPPPGPGTDGQPRGGVLRRACRSTTPRCGRWRGSWSGWSRWPAGAGR